jgi:hypothetical protein
MSLGIWLMAAPDTLDYADPARTNDHVFGPLVAMFGLIAVTPETRPVRWVNVPLGLWLVAAPWLLGYADWVPVLNSMLVGVAVAALATVRGRITHRYGGGWAALWKPELNHGDGP